MSDRFTVLVADRVSESGLAPLLEDRRFRVVRGGTGLEELEPHLDDADALIVRSATRVDDALLERAPALRVIGRAGVGVDNIDLDAATRRGVAVMNAPAGNTVSAAELAMALILSIARRIPAADRSVRRGEWSRSKFGGVELRGKTLGLIGAGRIGGSVAERGRAFGMETLAHDPFLTKEKAEEIGVDRVELDELVRRSDVISIHVPLTDVTRGMIDAERLAAMKPGAFLVNAARGGVVDERALVESLESGHLGGAALDVFEREPIDPDHPLLSAPNLVLTPHLGASTQEAQELVAREIASAVAEALLEGSMSAALNAPSIAGEELRRIRPLLDLGRRLGRLGSALTVGGIHSVEIRYAGTSTDGLQTLASHVLVGLLSTILGADQVNFVNAPHLADERGLGVSRRRLARRIHYAEFVEVVILAEGGNVRVAGALLSDHHLRVVRIGDYHVDVEPRGSLLVLKNRDVPGVIGRVGTLLGDAGLNIAEYHQSRLSQGGEALAAIAVDGTVARAQLDALCALPEISEARLVEFAPD